MCPRSTDGKSRRCNRPAGTAEEVEVGGDFYDFFRTPAGWLAVLGDVTGRGVPAAARTSLLRYGARFLAKRDATSSRILAGLDEALQAEPDPAPCSAVCLRLEPGRLVIATAGHPPLLIVRDDGRIREVGPTGPLLGAMPDSRWTDRTVKLRDATVLVYTDGVTDTVGENGRFEEQRLRDLLAEAAGTRPSELLAALEAALGRFQVAAQADDTAAIALRPVSSKGRNTDPDRALTAPTLRQSKPRPHRAAAAAVGRLASRP